MCKLVGEAGTIVCAMTQRFGGLYLVSQTEVDEYNLKLKTVNAFWKTVLEDEPHLHFWRHGDCNVSSINQEGHLLVIIGLHSRILSGIVYLLLVHHNYVQTKKDETKEEGELLHGQEI